MEMGIVDHIGTAKQILVNIVQQMEKKEIDVEGASLAINIATAHALIAIVERLDIFLDTK